MKAARKPSRDDIARVLLHFAIAENLKRGREQEVFRLQDQVVNGLVAQGFDRAASNEAFEELIDKYRSGWDFQRKPHLGAADSSTDDID
jgi:hypothetical protein